MILTAYVIRDCRYVATNLQSWITYAMRIM